jgi:hypothetical protein
MVLIDMMLGCENEIYLMVLNAMRLGYENEIYLMVLNAMKEMDFFLFVDS